MRLLLMSRMSETTRSSFKPMEESLVSSVSGLQAWPSGEMQPVIWRTRLSSLICHLRHMWSTKAWCRKKIGSPGEPQTAPIVAPIPLWP